VNLMMPRKGSLHGVEPTTRIMTLANRGFTLVTLPITMDSTSGITVTSLSLTTLRDDSPYLMQARQKGSLAILILKVPQSHQQLAKGFMITEEHTHTSDSFALGVMVLAPTMEEWM